MPFQHRFLTVLGPFWRVKMALKSIKNRSKLSFRAFLFPYLFLHWFLIHFCPNFVPTSTHWISKNYIFLKEKQRFFKNALFEDNIHFGFDFGANLPPCWPLRSKIFRNYGVPRGLQNFIFFRIDFLSILAPSWPPTWGHLGSQDGSKFENLGPGLVLLMFPLVF